MYKRRKITAVLIVLIITITSVSYTPVTASAAVKGSKIKKTKRYTISRISGIYSSTIKVKVKAKKGYKIYYTTTGKLKKSKVIKSTKSKTFNIKKTTTLSIYVVKKSAKITKKKLKKVSKKKKGKYFVQYRYTIKKGTSISDTTESTTGNTSGSTSETPTSNVTTISEEQMQAQDKINNIAEQVSTDAEEITTQVPSKIESDTASVKLTKDGISTNNVDSDAITYESGDTLSILTIDKAGTYVLSGGTAEDPIKNLEIIVAKNISDEVNLIWDNLIIDNSQLGTVKGQDVPVFSVGKSTPAVNITLRGQSVFTGNGSYTEAPASAIISADNAGTTLTFSAYEGDSTASLTVVDSMASSTDFGTNDPSDGIYSKGTLIMNSGIYNVSVNGDCLKGTGKNGQGGIVINGGSYTLRSNLSNALKSKNGNIMVNEGNINSTYTKEDGINAKNYAVIITGGDITIDQCYGDGIQGENVNISGESTVIDIKTYFENAGINYYNSSLGSGNYNTMTKTETSKTEVVNVDTGSHKGIKGGTKACTYSYKSVEEGSELTAGTVYTQEASGGIVITGGTITIDTTNTGIKYNGNTGGNERPGQGSSGSGNLSAANNDGQYIIGSPDDTIHSNNTCVISGGTLKLSSSDDGITAPTSIVLINNCDITIDQCYEGIEGGEIIMGKSDNVDETPYVKIYSSDDGINAASKSSVNYVYNDESEEQYTKVQKSSSDNIFEVLDGYLNVMIGDDCTHSFSLLTESGVTTGTYNADGDGIDCNGSFYVYGGTIVVYGPNSNGNSPIDTDSTYYIGNGVTLLAVGTSGMTESPTDTNQAVITYPSSGNSNQNGLGQMGPSMGGPSGGMSGVSSLGANKAFAVLDGSNNVVLSIKPIKSYSYVLYSSPELKAGSVYTLYSGGSVSGSRINNDSNSYDYRYTGYSTSGASTLGTVTAK